MCRKCSFCAGKIIFNTLLFHRFVNCSKNCSQMQREMWRVRMVNRTGWKLGLTLSYRHCVQVPRPRRLTSMRWFWLSAFVFPFLFVRVKLMPQKSPTQFLIVAVHRAKVAEVLPWECIVHHKSHEYASAGRSVLCIELQLCLFHTNAQRRVVGDSNTSIVQYSQQDQRKHVGPTHTAAVNMDLSSLIKVIILHCTSKSPISLLQVTTQIS